MLLKKNNMFFNSIRKFSNNNIFFFNKNNFLFTKKKIGYLLESLLDPSIKISGVFRFKYSTKEELSKFFHPDFLLNINQIFTHRWIVINNVKVIDEDGNSRLGFLLSSVTSHTGKGEISIFTKTYCPSFLNDNSRLYYYSYFYDYDCDLKEHDVHFLKQDTLNFKAPFVHNYLVTAEIW